MSASEVMTINQFKLLASTSSGSQQLMHYGNSESLNHFSY